MQRKCEWCGTNIETDERIKVQIDLLECTNCGRHALGFMDLRITSHKCSGSWKVVETFMADFTIGELLGNAAISSLETQGAPHAVAD